MHDDVTLKLEGQAGTIHARSLHDALGAVLDLLEDAERSSAGHLRPWSLSTLKESSAVAGFAHPAAAPTLETLAVGLDTLRDRATIPTGWSTRMVDRVRRLGRLAGSGGAEGIQISLPKRELSWMVDTRMTSHADRALSAAEVTFGTVSGFVDSWRIRNGRRVGMTLDDGGTLTATFPKSLEERIQTQAIGHRIEVWGELERNAEGQPVGLVIADFAVAAQRLAIPPSRARGLFRESGMTLDEWLSRRDG